jgi:hypothetical protein
LGLCLLGTLYVGTGSVAIPLGVGAGMIATTFMFGLMLPKQARED